MTDIPEAERAARALAERVYAAYAQRTRGPTPPQLEQFLLTRLVAAIRPTMGSGEVTGAVNRALESWEQSQGQGGGPRFAQVGEAEEALRLA
ncbi:hypothetical protein [Methylobacterium sp. Leaf118]|uniref:hypothetical protein n=1 Tax=Methylobacterium sp. Leaf118 TaxID=2876562 RepID=UPI001E48F380|nr:hypothetical protein [Methylobacterium sp. Leaf118]